MGENLTFAPRKIKGLFITRDMSKKSNASKGRKFWRRLGKVILILFAISILLPILYRWVNPPVTTFQLVQAVSNGTGIHKKWVPIEKISPYMYRAAIASEDNYFLGHNGFDVIALNTVMEERKSGNQEFESARKSVKKYLDQIDLDEVQDFMMECIPGFAMTLDEISEE